jgi:hypothetical protein
MFKFLHSRYGKSGVPLLGIGVICVLLIALFVIAQFRTLAQPDSIEIRSANDAANFLAEFGWEVSVEPSSIRTVIIPTEFDALYTEYNDLQQTQGLDLTQYRGKTAVMYTFRVLNHPASESGVFANVLVHEGSVIAGDLVSHALDGFLVGLQG